jgi:hypothetical protein
VTNEKNDGKKTDTEPKKVDPKPVSKKSGVKPLCFEKSSDKKEK